MKTKQLKNIIEAALLAADHPLTAEQLHRLFEDDEKQPSKDDIRKVIGELVDECEGRGYELKKIASGYRYHRHDNSQDQHGSPFMYKLTQLLWAQIGGRPPYVAKVQQFDQQ